MFGFKLFLCLSFFFLVVQCIKIPRSEYKKQVHSLRGKFQKLKIDRLSVSFRQTISKIMKKKESDVIFLIDSSASVGQNNFQIEIKFVKKLLMNFDISLTKTRIVLITYSSEDTVLRQINQFDEKSAFNKCTLFELDLPSVTYISGGTFTLGALNEALDALKSSRKYTFKCIFLFTDGFSNGGDPRPVAENLKKQNVTIVTFGIKNGNIRELIDMASEPKELHSFILESFSEFDSLARKSLHTDVTVNEFILQPSQFCHQNCFKANITERINTNCCQNISKCMCSVNTGKFECLCPKGYYGNSLMGQCKACPKGTYKPNIMPGDFRSCIPCPLKYQESAAGSYHWNHCRCLDGYQYNGKNCVNLSCIQNANQDQNCMEVKNTTNVCKSLQSPPFGSIYPTVCMKKEVPNGTICVFACKPGFLLRGPAIRKCHNTKWTGYITTFCEDVTPPELKCPKDIHISTDLNCNYAIFNITEPNPKDNSEIFPILSSCPVVHPNMKFIIGRTEILFKAFDMNNNSINCSFSVYVEDDEPPIFDICESPPTFLLDAKKNELIEIEWNNPVFHDNSLMEVKLFFKIGKHAYQIATTNTTRQFLPMESSTDVTYRAIDHYGNEAFCTLQINLQSHNCLPQKDPLHGHSNCSKTNSTFYCSLACETGYGFTISSLTDYQCSKSLHLNTSITRIPLQALDIWQPSTNPVVFPDCSIAIHPKIETIFSMTVNFGDFTTILCEDRFFSEEDFSEAKNLINEAVSKAFCDNVFLCILEISQFNCVSRKKREAKTTQKVFVTISGKSLTKEYLLFEHIRNKIKSIAIANQSFEILNIKFHSTTSICQPGTILQAEMCYDCPAGTFQEESKCLLCPKGTYQHLKGQTSCIYCNPSKNYTRFLGAKRQEDCIGICQPGRYSFDGLEPCNTCEIGYFQPKSKAKTCKKCPDEKLSKMRGTFYKFDCYDVCQPGSISETGLKIPPSGCELCPPGFFQHKKGQKTCLKCDNEKYCGNEAVTMKPFINYDSCFKNPCKNNGSCIALNLEFACKCKQGYQGSRCETMIDFCLLEPCLNGGTCTSLSGDVRCKCQSGYSGKFCEVEDNYSKNHNYVYVKDACDSSHHLLRNDFVLTFGEKKINPTLEYILHTDDLYLDLNEASFCFWMSTSDKENYGTVLSYATLFEDNELTFTDYGGFVLSVKGKKVVTDIAANDGKWTFLCGTWTSANGKWAVYVNGQVAESGSGLAESESIRGGGTLVIGQEQDSPGGHFSSAESFRGNITRLNMWSRAITHQQVLAIMNSCQPIHGDLIAWPDLYAGIHGFEKIGELQPCPNCAQTTIDDDCSQCHMPCKYVSAQNDSQGLCEWTEDAFPNGEAVDLSPPTLFNRSEGFYEAGAQLLLRCDNPNASLEGSSTLTCTSEGRWHPELPVCETQPCSEVPRMANGRLLGEEAPPYEMGSKVRFGCLPGFRMVNGDQLACLSSGIWGPVDGTPKCSPISCPRAFPHHWRVVMIRMPSEFGYNASAGVSCAPGYAFPSGRTALSVRCNLDGQWEQVEEANLRCRPIECDLPGDLLNGMVEFSGLRVGSMARYSCERPFALKGRAQRRCLPSGQWSHALPTCIKQM